MFSDSEGFLDRRDDRNEVRRDPALRFCEVLYQLGSVGVVLTCIVVVDGLLDEVTRPYALIDRGLGRVSTPKQRLAVDLGDGTAVARPMDWAGSPAGRESTRPA